MVEAAARNWGSGEEIMALLLDRGGDALTTEGVEAAVGNGKSSKEIIALLLNQRGGDVGGSGPDCKKI